MVNKGSRKRREKRVPHNRVYATAIREEFPRASGSIPFPTEAVVGYVTLYEIVVGVMIDTLS